jgi:hypothetical protein
MQSVISFLYIKPENSPGQHFLLSSNYKETARILISEEKSDLHFQPLNVISFGCKGLFVPHLDFANHLIGIHWASSVVFE